MTPSLADPSATPSSGFSTRGRRFAALAAGTVLLAGISLAAPVSTAHAASTTTVYTPAAIQTAINDGFDDIVLGEPFAQDAAANVVVPAGKAISIRGVSKANPTTLTPTGYTGASLNVTSGGAGASLNLSSIRIVGHNTVDSDGHVTAQGTAGGGIRVSSFSGSTMTIDDVQVEGVRGNSAVMASIGDGTLIVKNSSFIGGRSGQAAGMYASVQGGIVRVENSTFLGNVGDAFGYFAGGIVFENNLNSTVTFSNVAVLDSVTHAGRGGGLAIHNSSSSTFSFEDSYFAGNTTNVEGVTSAWNNNTRADGGAIAMNLGSGNTLNVDSSTFADNTAFDEAGAIEVESTSAAVNIRNSTFFNNRSLGLQTYTSGSASTDSSGGAGAIEVYTAASAVYDSNTFVGNRAEHGTGTMAQRGGAVYQLTGSKTFRNNLFADNFAYNSPNYAAVSASGSTATGNVGFDAGTALPAEVTTEAILGTTTPALAANSTKVQAGDPRTSLDGVRNLLVPTVMILPGDPADTSDDAAKGLADNVGATTTAVDDERNAPRDTTPDAGALEIAWVKCDANGGSWPAKASLDYDGTIWYSTTADPLKKVYDVYVPGASATSCASSLGDPTNEGRVFLGWGTAPDSGVDVFNDTTPSVTAEDVTYYAQWRDAESPSPTPTPTDPTESPSPTPTESPSPTPTSPAPTSPSTGTPETSSSPTSAPTDSPSAGGTAESGDDLASTGASQAATIAAIIGALLVIGSGLVFAARNRARS